MTGRIKLLKNDQPTQNTADVPKIPYEYDIPGEFDEQCGTFGLDEFQLPHPECPDRFVCDISKNKADIAQFSKCIEAMDCHMLAGMTTNIESQSAIALFVHQMVPHHQNAVNMAKALLKTGKVVCDDLTEESDACTTEVILHEIVNNQNFQIQAMYDIVDEMGYPKEDDCEVLIGDGLNNAANPTPPPAASAFTAINSNRMMGILTLVIATLFTL